MGLEGQTAHVVLFGLSESWQALECFPWGGMGCPCSREALGRCLDYCQIILLRYPWHSWQEEEAITPFCEHLLGMWLPRSLGLEVAIRW